MQKYLAALALVLALAVWNYYPYLYPAEPTPAPVAVEPAPALVDESSPGYIGTVVVNGIEVRIFEPQSELPIAPVAPSTVAQPQFRLNTWMNGHSAWAGLTSSMFGPIVAITGVMMVWLLLVSGRRLFYRRA